MSHSEVPAPASGTPTSVSVCICTHNRASLLSRTLERLRELGAPDGVSVDVIVVDNGSTDGTRALVNEFVATDPERFSYVHEPELGLAHARNRGLRETRSAVVVFLDDDAVPRGGWLEALLEGYRVGDDVAVVGGQVLLDFEGPGKPRWLTKPLYDCYSERNMGAEQEIVECHDLGEYPYGANVSFRTDVARSMGGFDATLGQRGRSFSRAGEESQLCRVISDAGYRILMHPRAVVDHVIPRERMTLRYLARLGWAEGPSSVFIPAGSQASVMRILGRGSWRAARVFWRFAASPRDVGSLVKGIHGLVVDASALSYLIKIRGDRTSVESRR